MLIWCKYVIVKSSSGLLSASMILSYTCGSAIKGKTFYSIGPPLVVCSLEAMHVLVCPSIYLVTLFLVPFRFLSTPILIFIYLSVPWDDFLKPFCMVLHKTGFDVIKAEIQHSDWMLHVIGMNLLPDQCALFHHSYIMLKLVIVL